MSDEDPDWTETIGLGEGARTSRARQLGFALAILAVSIAALVGLVVAGAALFRTASDRAHHTSRSYEYGTTYAASLPGVPASTDAATRRDVCELALTQHKSLPSWLNLADATKGCADALGR